MRRLLLFVGFLTLPIAALALDVTDSTGRYKDAARFSMSERAAISVLTNLGAIGGYPDGTFLPNRSLNRAEFLKIVFASHPTLLAVQSDASECFPDVHTSDWFSKYVCLAKKRGTVGGYPDGFFHPERTVNYAEALKMLGELYNLKLSDDQLPAYNEWFVPYREAAIQAGVALPDLDGHMEHLLTRGEIAVLTSSYRANHDGVMGLFRMAMRGETIPSSSSASSFTSSQASNASTSLQSTSSSSVSSASSVSSVSSSMSLFPSQSHFLLIGRTSKPVFDATFTAMNDDGIIHFVDVTLRQEVKGLSGLLLVDVTGKIITSLKLATDSNSDHRKWHAEIAMGSGSVTLKNGVPTQLGVEAVLKTHANGAVSNEIFDLESFSMLATGKNTQVSMQLAATNINRPVHQTTDARITAVRNAGSGSSVLAQGNDRLIGRFSVSGETMTGGALTLDSIEFVLASTDAAVTNVRIGGQSTVQQAGCSFDSTQTSHILCTIIPDAFKSVGKTSMILSLYGDVSLRTGSTGGVVQIVLQGTGKIGQPGAIHWADAGGHYNWVEGDVPLENGTQWTVKP